MSYKSRKGQALQSHYEPWFSCVGTAPEFHNHQPYVGGQHRTPTSLPPEKESPVHIRQETRWVQEPIWTGGKEKTWHPYQESNPNSLVVQPVT
jgi:hypothetical protein